MLAGWRRLIEHECIHGLLGTRRMGMHGLKDVGNPQHAETKALQFFPSFGYRSRNYATPINRLEHEQTITFSGFLNQGDSGGGLKFSCVASGIQGRKPCRVRGEIETEGRLVTFERFDKIYREILFALAGRGHVAWGAPLGDGKA